MLQIFKTSTLCSVLALPGRVGAPAHVGTINQRLVRGKEQSFEIIIIITTTVIITMVVMMMMVIRDVLNYKKKLK